MKSSFSGKVFNKTRLQEGRPLVESRCAGTAWQALAYARALPWVQKPFFLLPYFLLSSPGSDVNSVRPDLTTSLKIVKGQSWGPFYPSPFHHSMLLPDLHHHDQCVVSYVQYPLPHQDAGSPEKRFSPFCLIAVFSAPRTLPGTQVIRK